MSRTLLNADTGQALTNEIFGGGDHDGPLAVYNAIFEIQNRKLVALDGGDEAADDESVTLAGVVGHCHLEGDEFSYRETLEEDGEDPREIILLAESAIGELPTGEILPGNEPTRIQDAFPSTLAVMAVWRAADGRLWTAFYRHPLITAAEATFILKELVEEFSHDEGSEPAPSN